jgi:hypothetical protein
MTSADEVARARSAHDVDASGIQPDFASAEVRASLGVKGSQVQILSSRQAERAVSRAIEMPPFRMSSCGNTGHR